MWFTLPLLDKVGVMTPSGHVTEFRTRGATPWGIALGPDANMWFGELFGNAIGRVITAPVPTMTVHPHSGAPGTVVTVTGSGFGGIEKVVVAFFDSANGVEGMRTVATDPSGRFTSKGPIPDDVTPGTQAIQARGRISRVHIRIPFTVT